MRLFAPLALACSLTGCSAAPADREFKEVVRAISDEFQTKPVHIPLFGLVNVAVKVVRPAGAKHIDLAVFEDLGSGSDDWNVIAAKIRHAVGEEWKPFVQVRSNDGAGEITLIYLRPDGKDCKLLVTTIEPNDATVMQLKLNPEGLERWIRAPLAASKNLEKHEDYEP